MHWLPAELVLIHSNQSGQAELQGKAWGRNRASAWACKVDIQLQQPPMDNAAKLESMIVAVP